MVSVATVPNFDVINEVKPHIKRACFGGGQSRSLVTELRRLLL
jgi:hypothetical protein